MNMYSYCCLYNSNGYNYFTYNCKFSALRTLKSISVANVLDELSKYDIYNKENSLDGINQVREERWIKDNIFKIYKEIMGNSLKKLDVDNLAGYLYLIDCYLNSDEYKKQIKEIERNDPYITEKERQKLNNSKIKLKDKLVQIMREWLEKTKDKELSNDVSAAVVEAIDHLNDFKDRDAELSENADKIKRNLHKILRNHPELFKDDIFKGCQLMTINEKSKVLNDIVEDTYTLIEIDLKREAIYYDNKVIDNLVTIKKLCARIYLSVPRYEVELRKELKRECAYISGIINEFLATTLVKQND